MDEWDDSNEQERTARAEEIIVTRYSKYGGREVINREV